MQAVCVRATASLQLSTAFCQIHQWQPRLCLSRVLPVLQPLGTRARCSALTAVRSSDCTDSQDSTTVAQSKQLHRFYAPQLPPVVGAAVELDPEEARHAMRVLRLQPGDAVELCDGRGSLVRCEVAAASKTSAMLVTTDIPVAIPWRGPQWVLAAACLTLKGGRTDWLVEKATELGAHTVLPLITQRSNAGSTKEKFRALARQAGGQQKKRPRAAADAAADAAAAVGDAEGGSGELQAPRMERLALAATKQSLRAHALQLHPPTPLEQLLPELQQAPVALVAAAGAPPILSMLQEQLRKQQHAQQQQQQQQQEVQAPHPWCGQRCYLLIGPEGDFTSDEVAQLSEAGVLPVGLGPNRLRTETAAIAALSAAMLVADSSSSGSSSSLPAWQGNGLLPVH